MTGLFLNAYPVALGGRLTLWRFRAERGETKRQLRERHGVPLWVNDGRCWACEPPAGVDVEQVQIAAGPADPLRLFAAREALLTHANGEGRQGWASKGEVSCVGLRSPVAVDRFLVEHVLVMRLSTEEYAGSEPVLVVRRRTRWKYDGDLTDPALRNVAVGARAVRLRGDGPPGGRIATPGGDDRGAVLRVGADLVTVEARDYTVVADSSLVLRLAGGDSLVALQVASGSLTRQRRRNRYAVRHRFEAAGQMTREFGTRIPLPGGDGHLEVARIPVGVEVGG